MIYGQCQKLIIAVYDMNGMRNQINGDFVLVQ